MRKEIAVISTGLLTLLAISLPAFSQAKPPAPAPRSAYEALDNNKLMQNLTNMKMSEFMQEFAKGLSGTEKDLVDISALIMQADGTADQKKREEIFDEAFKKQEQIVDAMTKKLPTSEKDITGEDLSKVYNARITLIDIQGLRRTKIYTDRMLYLLAGAEDIKEVTEHTTMAVELLDKLTKDINNKLTLWSQDNNRLIADRPVIEELLPVLKYKSAWIKYYNGSSIASDDRAREAERKKVLNASIDQATEFVNNKDYGVYYWGLRLRAGGYRETGQYKVAEADFATILTDAQATADVKLEALFESARNQAEYGASFIKEDQVDKGTEKFNAALESVKKFPEAAVQVMGEGARLGIDLKAAMLEGYIYELWSKAIKPKDAKKAEEYSVKAQDSFLNLMTKYPQYTNELIQMYEDKYRTGSGGASPETMPPAILYGLARRELQKRSDEAAQKKAMEYLNTLIARAEKGEAGAVTLYPLALLDKGITSAYQKKYREAAELLLKVVIKFPDFEKAALAAYNAVNVYNNLINQHAKSHPGEDIPVNDREGLINCIRVMLAKYEKDPASFKTILEGMPEKDRDLRIWYWDLGFNSEIMAEYADSSRQSKASKTASSAPAESQPASAPALTAKTREQWLTEAIAAYEKYPQDKPEYIQCRDRIVHITWKPYEDYGEEELKANKDTIVKVLPKLQDFVTFAQQKLGQLKPVVDTADNKQEVAKKVVDLLKAYEQVQPESPEAVKLKNTIDYKQLQESGSWAEFAVLSLRYDLNGEKAVLAEIDKFPEKWPGMDILRFSMEFVIRKLVDEGRIKEAIAKVQEFQRKYSAKEATDLIALVLSKVRKKISELQALAKKDNAKKQELATYVKAYSEFAGTLYDEGKKSGAEAEKMYPLTQMYGESLLLRADIASDDEEKNKYFKDAEVCFKECYDFDLKERQQKFKKEKLDEIDRRTKEAESAGTNATKLASVTRDYFKFCTDNNIEIVSGQEIQLKLTAGEMETAPNEGAREPLARKVSELVVAVYKALPPRVEGIVPIDATNVRGIAKCAIHLKDYKTAKDFYDKLLKGLDQWKYPDMYWEAKVDSYEAQLELARKAPVSKEMDSLAMAIHKLLVDADGNPKLFMYVRPYREKLLDIENQARKMSKTKYVTEDTGSSGKNVESQPSTAPASEPAKAEDGGAKPEAEKKPEGEKKAEGEKKPETEKKPDADKAPESAPA